ncbi:MAG: ThuA domain-containing protein [Chitinophagia bacterium]|nr:ThuA domain-containing protein [Chitinophagia bacterium]
MKHLNLLSPIRLFLVSIVFLFSSSKTIAADLKNHSIFTNKLKGSNILLYTKNGKGYVHDNIPAAVECLKSLAASEKFTLDVSDDPSIFTEDNLKKYQLIVFTSTNNDVFDTDNQRLAFRHYIEAGGGFVGVHSVTGTERNWTWFKMMLGETFSWHARFQAFSLKKIDKTHPSMTDVPDQWVREDECYFGKELYPGMKVLMVHEVNSLNPADSTQIKKNMGSFVTYYPAVWYQHFEGGNIWITTLGHSKQSYQDPVYVNHLLQGLRYVAGAFKGLDFSKATAKTKDDELKK